MIAGGDSYFDLKLLEQEHTNNLVTALQMFDEAPRMGGEDISQDYRAGLKQDLQNYYEKLHDHYKARIIVSYCGAIVFAVVMIALP